LEILLVFVSDIVTVATLDMFLLVGTSSNASFIVKHQDNNNVHGRAESSVAAASTGTDKARKPTETSSMTTSTQKGFNVYDVVCDKRRIMLPTVEWRVSYWTDLPPSLQKKHDRDPR
jgi:hypothetical protein